MDDMQDSIEDLEVCLTQLYFSAEGKSTSYRHSALHAQHRLRSTYEATGHLGLSRGMVGLP